MFKFTPKRFLDFLEYNDLKLTNLVENGVDRSYFIPRYKEGSRRIKDLDYSYSKGLSIRAIEKITDVSIKMGIITENKRTLMIACFKNDNFDALYDDFV